MLPRRRLAALVVPMLLLAGCGWTPLYADHEPSAGDQDLRAIRVSPIAERIGQKLELALRTWFNPTGEPTPTRYILNTTLSVVRLDLGISSQGLGTRARLEANAAYVLHDIRSGAPLTTGNVHVSQSFDILANQYANIVAEQDARNRAVEELRRELTTRLEVFFQRHAAAAPPPAAPR